MLHARLSRPARTSIRWLPLLVTMTTALAGAPVRAETGPAGHLLIVGGGDRPPAIMQVFARLAGGASGKVLIFPQASSLPETGERMRTELAALGIGQVEVVDVDRAGADRDDVLARADGATGVWFAGGDQTRLMAVLSGTALAQRLAELYEQGAVMAGTSAGAAVMSAVMITGDERRPLSTEDSWQTIEAGNVVTAEGLGFLREAIVDQHFVRRKRHNRLISAVIERPHLVGLGIDEATAAWVKPGGTIEILGAGPVLVLDARGAALGHDPDGTGLRAADLRMHILRAGAVYDLRAGRVVRLGPE